MYKLEFTLKQHTPIIHFQHDQEGATLRATEVKPKLDRFILMKLGNGDYEEGRKIAREKVWLIDKDNDKDKGALDYKIKITLPEYSPGKIEIKQNIKIITDSTENSILYKGDIVLQFLLTNQELKKTLEKLLNEFFIVTSFGKRQNKGFGCFYKKDLSFDTGVKPVLNGYNWYLLNETNNNLLQFDNNRFKNNYNFYLVISDKWRKLKSGFNHGGTYIKSSVFKYLCNQGLRWDKRWLKKELKPLIRPQNLKASRTATGFNSPNDCGGRSYNCGNTPNYNNWDDNTGFSGQYRFGRAMVGLAEHYEFKNSNGQITYQVQIKSENVERYKAPVTFKVFDNEIFAIAENQNLYNANFYFKVKVKQENVPDNLLEIKDTRGNWKILKTPKNATEWDLVKFLDAFFPCINFIKQ